MYFLFDVTTNTIGNIFLQINIVIFTIFAALYIYQNIFIIISAFTKSKKFPESKNNHYYGYIIAARNEENVIEHLINSIAKQDYPKELMQIFIICDNCTDNTAQICKSIDVGIKIHVYERFDTVKVGKSHALDFLFKKILESKNKVDAFIVFDADNLVDKNYTKEINKVYEYGYKIITSYRNSKNYGKNILTSGSGLCYLRECVFLHKVRTLLNLSTYVSGTGFLVDYSIIEENKGWVYHLMIEDLEFSTDQMLKNVKIGYAHDAIFYDEQPIKFKDSYNQRMRWLKGTYQCFYKFTFRILKQIFSFKKETKNRFSVFEMGLFFAPIPAISAIWLLIYNIGIGTLYFLGQIDLTYVLNTSVKATLNFTGLLFLYSFIFAGIISVKERKRLKTKWYKKILYTLTFPLFILTYTPIVVFPLFTKVTWKVIPHTDVVSIDNIDDEKR